MDAAQPTTLETVTRICVEHLGSDPAAVTPAARFAEDLAANGLDQIELVMAMEEHFGVEIADAEADAVRTVGELVALVDGKLQARGDG